MSVTTDNPRIPLAGTEPAVWFEYVLKLGPVYPLEAALCTAATPVLAPCVLTVLVRRQVLTSEGQAPQDHLMSSRAHAPFSNAHAIVAKGGEYNTTFGPIYPNSP